MRVSVCVRPPTCIFVRNPHNQSHPCIVPWVHHPLVSNAHLTSIFHASLSCAFFFSMCMYISSLLHSFTSSNHSLFGRPLFIFPFISPNTTSFTSLLSSRLVKKSGVRGVTTKRGRPKSQSTSEKIVRKPLYVKWIRNCCVHNSSNRCNIISTKMNLLKFQDTYADEVLCLICIRHVNLRQHLI